MKKNLEYLSLTKNTDKFIFILVKVSVITKDFISMNKNLYIKFLKIVVYNILC